MSNAQFASPQQIEFLGQTALAVRVKGGRVPEGCLGLSQQGTEIRRFSSGEEVEAPRLGKLWWVHPGPVELRFAPDARAPEAGVALLVLTHTPDGHLADALADWLDGHGSVTGTAELIGELSGHILLQLPPCVQKDELQKRAIGLSRALMKRGLRCNGLIRDDRYPDTDCRALWLQADQPDVSEPVPHSATPPDILHATMPASASPAQPDIHQAIALDARFERRLFHELGPLATRMRDLAWPDDAAAFDTQRALLRRLEHLAATTARLPTLENRISPTPIRPERIRLLAVESRRAAEGLDEAWSILGSDADNNNDAPDLDALDRIVAGIEIAIARRRTKHSEMLA